MKRLKRAILRSLSRLGYEVVRPGYGIHDNPLAAQVHLLREAPVEVVLDVGAHVGQSAERYLEAFPAATVHCFEPFSESFALLQERSASRPNVRAHNLAVAESAGPRRFLVNRRSSTNSLHRASPEAGRYVDGRLLESLREVQVTATTLDRFCQEQGIERVDVLKLDVQGGEVEALKGAQGLLSEERVRLIYTEAHFASLYEGDSDFHSIAAALQSHGYVLYGLYDLNYGRNGVLAWADALFISPSLERAL